MNSLKRTLKFVGNKNKSEMLSLMIILVLLYIFSFFYSLIMSNKGLDHVQAFGILIKQSDGTYMHSIAGGNFLPLLLVFIVSTYILYYEALPVVIGFSSTRKNFTVSVIINNIVFVTIISLFQTILLKLDFILIKRINWLPITDYKTFNTSTDNFVYIFLLLFLLSLFILGIFNLLASANYKFGYRMWLVIALAFILIMPLFGEKILTFFSNMVLTRISFIGLLFLIISSVVSFGLSGLITKNANIKPKLNN